VDVSDPDPVRPAPLAPRPESTRRRPFASRASDARRSLPRSIGAALLAAAIVALAACSSAATPTTSPAATATASPVAPPSASVAVTSPSPSASPIAYPLTLTDDEGTTVTLATAPKRIISLTPAVTETLFAVGAGSRVVATTDFDDYPPEALGLPHVASYSAVDVEKIVGLQPDLVIAGGNGFNDPAAIARLRSLKVPVLVVYAPDVKTVLADISLVGAAAGQPAEAAAIVARMQADVDAVRAATSGLALPRVFYELDATKEIFGPADDSFVAEMISIAGGDPITTGSTTSFSIPLERLVAADPEIILLGDAAYGVSADQVTARSGWGTMTAVRSGAIRPVDDLLITRPGPRLTQGLRDLTLAIHPDLVLPSPAASGTP
jgi:iron complex transport system substrate-binding protein